MHGYTGVTDDTFTPDLILNYPKVPGEAHAKDISGSAPCERAITSPANVSVVRCRPLDVRALVSTLGCWWVRAEQRIADHRPHHRAHSDRQCKHWLEFPRQILRRSSRADQLNHLSPELRCVGCVALRHRWHLLLKSKGVHRTGSTPEPSSVRHAAC